MRKFVFRLWQNDFFRGGIFFTASSFIANAMNYLFNLFAGRSLGPQNYSEITALFSYMSITGVPVTVLSTFIVQKISSSGDKKLIVAKSLEQLFWNKVKNYWFLIFFSLMLIPFVPKITNLSLLSGTVLIPFIVLSFFSSFYSSTMQGLRLFFTFFALSILAGFLKLSGSVLTILGVGGLSTIIFFLSLSSVIPLILGFQQISKYLNKKLIRPIPRIQKKITTILFNRQLLLILFSTLGLTLLNNVDIVIAKKFLSSMDAGIYGSWSLFAKIIFYFLGPLISISFIFFSSENARHKDTFHLSIVVLLIIALFSYFFYSNFGPFAINIFFGNKFMGVLPYLKQASIAGSLYACIAFTNYYFVAKKCKEAFILPLFVPIYLVLLIFIDKSISSIISLNITFSLFLTVLYLFSYIRLLRKAVN